MGGLASAQAAVPVVTLGQALDYAQAHQPAIRGTLAEYEARRDEARAVRAAWLPRVGATVQVFGATENQTTASYVNVPEVELPRVGGTQARTQATASWAPAASTLAGLGVTQEAYDFGRISAEEAVADARAALAQADAQAAALDVALGVDEAFHGVLAARDILQATEDAYKRATVHRDFAEAGTRSGLLPAIDLTRAQADVARLEAQRIHAQAGLRIAQAALAAAMGSEVPAVDAAPTTVGLGPSLALAEALRRAAGDNPMLLAAIAELNARKAGVRAVTHELLPDLSVVAGIDGRAGGALPSSGAEVPYGAGWLPDVANWHLGLVLRWRLFDGTVLARRAAAQAREREASAGVDRAQLDIELATERAWVELDAALRAVPDLQASLDAARANEMQADARFRSGLGTLVDLADAESLLTNAQLELAIGQFSVARARAELGRDMGRAPASSAQKETR